MAKFELPPEEETTIDITSPDGNTICKIEVFDIVSLAERATEDGKKRGVDSWDLFIAYVESEHQVKIPNKTTALTLFNMAKDMLMDLKKKSFLSRSQLDILELLQQDSDIENSDSSEQ